MFIRELSLRSPVSISPFSTTDQAIDLMWRNDIRHLLVTDHDGLVGLVTDGDLLESVGMLMREEREYMAAGSAEEILVADIMDAEAACVTPGTLLADVAHSMIYGGRTALPVVDGGRLLGIVTEMDLLGLFNDPGCAAAAVLRDEPVINHSSRMLRTVSRHDPVRKVCEKLNGSKHRHVLVVEDGRLVGMISDWDVRMIIGRSRVGEWLDLPLDGIIVKGVSLRPDDSLERVARLMRQEKLTAVPIATRDGLRSSMATVSELLRVLVADAVIHA